MQSLPSPGMKEISATRRSHACNRKDLMPLENTCESEMGNRRCTPFELRWARRIADIEVVGWVYCGQVLHTILMVRTNATRSDTGAERAG